MWKRLGMLLLVGVLALSLTYLFKPRPQPVPPAPAQPQPEQSAKECLNINSATIEELERLPGIGQVIAARIVEHRQKHGPFARAEDILIIDGISDKKYRAIAPLICAR
jgi:competence protein ComEA